MFSKCMIKKFISFHRITLVKKNAITSIAACTPCTKIKLFPKNVKMYTYKIKVRIYLFTNAKVVPNGVLYFCTMRFLINILLGHKIV